MENLHIIHENKDYIVVNKTAGLISEKSIFEDVTIENQVHNHILKIKRTPYVGVIHRLDRVTSGVLIFAKKKSILIQFNELFSKRNVQKTYLAIVRNKPSNNKDNLTDLLLKNNLEKKADIVLSKSKNALLCNLTYKVIDKNSYGYLLEIKPKTGRYHQIRVQLANQGLPIVGDEKYGSDQKYLPLSVCLHAWKITYKNSETMQEETFKASLPNNSFWKFPSL